MGHTIPGDGPKYVPTLLKQKTSQRYWYIKGPLDGLEG